MNRLALRLMTKGVLLNMGVAPYPTMAGALVHDSHQGNVNDLESDFRGPQIIIRTDNDERNRQSSGASLSTRDVFRRLELRIEFAIWAARSVDGVAVNPWPVTDATLEAQLDFFEYQIEAAMFGPNKWGDWWAEEFPLESRTSSHHFIETDEGRVKLAAREMVLAVRAAPDCLPPRLRADEPVPAATLPKPLTSVFARIDADGSGDFKAYAAGIHAQLLAGVIPAGFVYPILNKVYFQIPAAITPAGQTPVIDIEGDLLQKST